MPVEAFAGGVAGESVSDPDDKALRKDSLDALRRKALADSADARTPTERRASYRRRSRAIRLYVLKRSEGKCEGCGCDALFVLPTGELYLEPRHIRRLTDGGPDHPRWVVAVCPNCHRRAHYSKDAKTYNELNLLTTSSSDKAGIAQSSPKSTTEGCEAYRVQV